MAVLVVVMVWALRDLALLVGYSVLLAYALLPVVRFVERLHDRSGRRLPRGVVAAFVMVALVVLVGWGVVLAVPRIAAEASRLAANAPANGALLLERSRSWAAQNGFEKWLEPTIEAVKAEAANLPGNLGGPLSRGALSVFGGVGHLLGLLLLPLLAFYLLAESEAVRVSAMEFVPEASREEMARLGIAVDRALRSYVRGQAIVCLVTGIAVGAGLALLQHPFALLLGILAGAAELIPYIGFLVAAGAIALTGASAGLPQAGIGVAYYVGLNWVIGTFVTPRLMGRHLRMHPFVITVSVLAGAKLLGAEGALLALPVAAAIQALIGELAQAPKAPQAPQAGDRHVASSAGAAVVGVAPMLRGQSDVEADSCDRGVVSGPQERKSPQKASPS